jgi:hypothetical protein
MKAFYSIEARNGWGEYKVVKTTKDEVTVVYGTEIGIWDHIKANVSQKMLKRMFDILHEKES